MFSACLLTSLLCSSNQMQGGFGASAREACVCLAMELVAWAWPAVHSPALVVAESMSANYVRSVDATVWMPLDGRQDLHGDSGRGQGRGVVRMDRRVAVWGRCALVMDSCSTLIVLFPQPLCSGCKSWMFLGDAPPTADQRRSSSGLRPMSSIFVGSRRYVWGDQGINIEKRVPLSTCVCVILPQGPCKSMWHPSIVDTCFPKRALGRNFELSGIRSRQ